MSEEHEKTSKAKVIIVSLVLIALMAVVGYTSMSKSDYLSVSDLSEISKKEKVNLEGSIVPLARGQFTLVIKSKDNSNPIHISIESHGSYAVGLTGEKGVVYAVFLLGPLEPGKQAKPVLALYRMESEQLAQQMGAGLQSEVVVSGTYDPQSTAILIDSTGDVVGEFNVIYVDAILRGCHTSYQQQSANIG